MALHPSSFEKLRAEITAYPADTDWTDYRLQDLEYRKFMLMSYSYDCPLMSIPCEFRYPVSAFISEVLRLYPPVPLK